MKKYSGHYGALLTTNFNIPVSDLTRNNAFAALKEKGIEDEKINNLADILINVNMPGLLLLHLKIRQA